MPDLPVKKNTAFTFFIPGFVSQANTKIFQVNPTIAAGDITISKDGGAFANPATLPDVEPNSTTQVRVILTADEMNADQITVKWSDASGAEWCDGSMMIFTSTYQTADLLRPTTAGRTLDVSATGEAGLDFDNIKQATGATTLTNITVPVVTTVTNYTTPPTVSAIADAVWDEALSGHTTAGTSGKSLSDAGSAGDPWSAPIRTLTQTAAQVAAAVSGSDLAITRYVDYAATITGLTISASWTKAYLTIKNYLTSPDAEAILQIVVSNPAASSTDGVLYVNGAAASVAQRTQGSLTVTQASGTIAIALADDLTAVLADGNYTWDLKILTATASAKPAGSGNVTISATETQSIA